MDASVQDCGATSGAAATPVENNLPSPVVKDSSPSVDSTAVDTASEVAKESSSSSNAIHEPLVNSNSIDASPGDVSSENEAAAGQLTPPATSTSIVPPAETDVPKVEIVVEDRTVTEKNERNVNGVVRQNGGDTDISSRDTSPPATTQGNDVDVSIGNSTNDESVLTKQGDENKENEGEITNDSNSLPEETDAKSVIKKDSSVELKYKYKEGERNWNGYADFMMAT